jgi:hypothetical protein
VLCRVHQDAGQIYRAAAAYILLLIISTKLVPWNCIVCPFDEQGSSEVRMAVDSNAASMLISVRI